MRLVKPNYMRELEKSADSAGYSYDEMMQAAGEGIACKCIEFASGQFENLALGLIGKGNNGGDTLIALTELQKRGWNTIAILIQPRHNEDKLVANLVATGGSIMDKNSGVPWIDEKAYGCRLILDGVFGTGFLAPMANEVAEYLVEIRKAFPDFTWVAVDCPSGINCDSGEVSPGSVPADLTICLEAVKTGLLTRTAFPYCGDLFVVELGISEYANSVKFPEDLVVDMQLVDGLLPKRDAFSHKGSYGKVLIMGGCVNYPGAPVLSGRGAYTVGAGLVQVAVPESIANNLSGTSLELTWLILEDSGGVISEAAISTMEKSIENCQCLVLGLGIGREPTTKRLVHSLVFNPQKNANNMAGFPGVRKSQEETSVKIFPPVVLDADALTLIAEEPGWFEIIRVEAVLTPHPGEMSRLSGLAINDIQENRVEVAREFSKKWGQVLVLKGPLSVVATPDGLVCVIPVATSALAKAGTGDVLAGMIGGLIAQGLSARDAAIAGAWMHAQAGLLAAERIGCEESVQATDVIQAIPAVYRKQAAQ